MTRSEEILPRRNSTDMCCAFIGCFFYFLFQSGNVMRMMDDGSWVIFMWKYSEKQMLLLPHFAFIVKQPELSLSQCKPAASHCPHCLLL